jgi:transcription elongation factor GreA
MAQYTLLTQQGYEKMKAEVEELRSNGRREASRAIAEAREKGDLSENAEYDAAKDAQGMLEAKIAGLEIKLANARIIDESQLDDSKVSVLSTVTVEHVKMKREITYKAKLTSRRAKFPLIRLLVKD